jgi:hypothetical protein
MSDSLDRLKAALAHRYAFQRELGRGGTATVHLATDLRHDRPVALKVLQPELAAVLGPERFLREIQTTARLTHPHILPLLDSGDVDGTLFHVMPYVAGESLALDGIAVEECCAETVQYTGHDEGSEVALAPSYGPRLLSAKCALVCLECARTGVHQRHSTTGLDCVEPRHDVN